MKTCLASTANQFAFTSGKSGRSPLHRAAAYPLQQPRGNSRAVLSFLIGNHYRIVIIGKTNFFWCDHLPVENRKMDCENDKSSARSNGGDRPRVQRGGAT